MMNVTVQSLNLSTKVVEVDIIKYITSFFNLNNVCEKNYIFSLIWILMSDTHIIILANLVHN